MKPTHLLAIAALATAAALPAQAEILEVAFTGSVVTAVGATPDGVGDTVSGEFFINTATGGLSSFTVAGQSIPAGYDSTALLTPGRTDAIYQEQISPVALGVSTNYTAALDLSSLTTWPSTDTAITLLTDTHQLATNLDTVTNPLSAFPSTFTYNESLSDGTTIALLTSDVTDLTVVPAPEPASLLLLASSMLGLAAARRRV